MIADGYRVKRRKAYEKTKQQRVYSMAYAPIREIKNVIGTFKHKGYDTSFDYVINSPEDSWLPVVNYPHRVWVCNNPIAESGWRYANVKKTVVDIVVDEDAYGQPIIEKWSIKNHLTFDNYARKLGEYWDFYDNQTIRDKEARRINYLIRMIKL
jgi:hypothetical protein